MATARLRERKKMRQQRREAAMRLSQISPEARAAARSQEERVGRRIAVMEEVLGTESASRFEQGMHDPEATAAAASEAARLAYNVRTTSIQCPVYAWLWSKRKGNFCCASQLEKTSSQQGMAKQWNCEEYYPEVDQICWQKY
jgi:hypothetical protein